MSGQDNSKKRFDLDETLRTWPEPRPLDDARLMEAVLGAHDHREPSDDALLAPPVFDVSSREQERNELRAIAKLAPTPTSPPTSPPVGTATGEDSGIIHLKSFVPPPNPVPNIAPPLLVLSDEEEATSESNIQVVARPAPARQKRATPAPKAPAKAPRQRPWAWIGVAAVAAAAAGVFWMRPTTTTTTPVAVGPQAVTPTGAAPVRTVVSTPNGGPIIELDTPPKPGSTALPAGAIAAAPHMNRRVATTHGEPQVAPIASAAPPAAEPPPPEPPPAPVAVASAPPAPTATDPPDLNSAIRQHVGESAEGAAKPAAGSTGSGGNVPQKPSQGAVTGALGTVLPQARACLGPDDPIARATIVFNGTGAVQSVTVTGGGAGTPAEACIRDALGRARLQPFAEPTFTAPVTVRHL